MPQNMDESNMAIADQIRAAFPDQQIGDIKKLADFLPGYQSLTKEFLAVKQELNTVKTQLEGVLPQLERASQASVADLEMRAAAAHSGLETSIGKLETRDREISEELNVSFQHIDSQLEGVSLTAATVKSMQDGIHGVVAKQQKDMDGMRIDVERLVANAIATITWNTQGSQGPGEQQGQG